METFAIEFGAHLRLLRRKAGLTQEEVAHSAGIHVTYLSGIERGKRNPSLRNIQRIAVVLGIPVKGLFSFEA